MPSVVRTYAVTCHVQGNECKHSSRQKSFLSAARSPGGLVAAHKYGLEGIRTVGEGPFHESLSNFGARETAFPRSRMTLSHHTCGSRRRVGQKHGTKRDFDDTVDGLRRKGKVVSATSYLIDPETWSSPGGCMKLFLQACRILAGPRLLLRAMFARNCECLKRSTDTVSNGVADANTGKVYVISCVVLQRRRIKLPLLLRCGSKLSDSIGEFASRPD